MSGADFCFLLVGELVAWVIHVGFNFQWLEWCSIHVASRGMEGMDFTGEEAVA